MGGMSLISIKAHIVRGRAAVVASNQRMRGTMPADLLR